MDVSSAVPGIVSARPGGWRVVFVPSAARYLGANAAAGLVVPALVTLPVTLLLLVVVAAFGGAEAAWYTALVVAGILAVLGVALAVFVFFHEFAAVRWVELSPAEAPEFLLVKRILGQTRIPVTELRRVTVRHRVKMGKPNGVDVVFHTAAGEIECPRVPDATHLVEWLQDVLVDVEVDRERAVDRLNLTSDQWWPRAKVAADWGVPIEAVPALADHLSVRAHFFVPRAAARLGDTRGMDVYDPDDVQEITDQLAEPSAERKVAALMLQRLTSLAKNAAEDKSSQVLGEVMPDAELTRRYRAALTLTSRGDSSVAHAQYSLVRAAHGEPLPPEGAEVPADFATVLAETLATAPVLRPTRFD
ncbi:hypothetical protein AB5J62_20660 [Amycolatopsis sp. cg5]|uniref:hypothetical protein n=1 Tax=Amycolatopsis sp. cg5 TaxID=3238802 RepID=UPI003523DCEF